MIATPRIAAALAFVGVLGGCAAAPAPRSAPPAVGTRPPVTAAPVVQNNDLIGRGVDAVARMFGKPRLDVSEGAGRKLQFAAAACIIDIYFYAPRAGADPVATHVDARTPDGRNAEVASCISAIRR